MDTRTGEIVSMKEVEKMKPAVAKWFKEIPNELLPELRGMNRKQRRAWYRENKKRFK